MADYLTLDVLIHIEKQPNLGLFRVEPNSFEADQLGATRFAAAAASVVSFVRVFGHETARSSLYIMFLTC